MLRSRRAALVRAACVTASGLAVCLGCTAPPDDGGHPDDAPHEALAAMTVVGGLCDYGTCRQAFAVARTGGWRLSENDRVVAEGRLSDGELRDLSAAVDRSAVVTGRLTPFTGTCPTASDGVEVTYLFLSGGTSHTVSTCDSVVPPDDPGVQQLDGVRDRIVGHR